jgi:histidine triad (HIT) family protein
MTAPGCPFCQRIENGEYDHDDGFSVAFEPLSPVTPGHLLVVPRQHVSSALAGPAVAGNALKFAAYLANRLDIGAANFITSAGKAATQSVFHLHVHIIPRTENDGLALPWTNQKRLRAVTEAEEAENDW